MSKKRRSPIAFIVVLSLLLGAGVIVYKCGDNSETGEQTSQNKLTSANIDADESSETETTDGESNTAKLPYTDNVSETVVNDYGKRAIRTQADESLCFPELMKNKSNCFIVISKKDYYLYVYEAQGKDTVMLARFDCALGLKKGDKTKSGDSRTPHCSDFSKPFHVSEIKNSSSWCHDFGDGRGSIKSYGDYFIRLKLAGHQVSDNNSIGIHGSTNNAESVPGRASEGCIRLKDADIITLRKNFVTEGMKVIVKAEDVDDYDFEVKAMQKQNISRKRHFNPAKTLTNEKVESAKAQAGRSKSSSSKTEVKPSESKNKTLEELQESRKTEHSSATSENTENKTLEELQGQ